MNHNCTNLQDPRFSALFIKECRKFISALNSNCSMEELTELRKRIIQIRSQEFHDDSEQNIVP